MEVSRRRRKEEGRGIKTKTVMVVVRTYLAGRAGLDLDGVLGARTNAPGLPRNSPRWTIQGLGSCRVPLRPALCRY